MNGKKWSVLFIILYAGIMLLIGGMVIIVDPYFHFHAPIKGFSCALENDFYINDGVSKRFTYNAMITGTSTTRSFRTKEAEKLFDKTFVRITYHGEGFKRINDNLTAAIQANPELDLVIRGLDTMWFIADKNWQGYEEYPDYLFDEILWNDVNYIYNKEILWKDVFGEIRRTIQGVSAAEFDDYTINDSSPGRMMVLEHYDRPARENKKLEQVEIEEAFDMLAENLNDNVISVIEENPDVTFYLFFPPYSICWWDSLHQCGNDILANRINMEQFAIEKLTAYDNVRLFSFFNNFDLICDLENYVDEVHYSDEVSSQLLIWMKEGRYELTRDNYLDYVAQIRDFYGQYDYESIFEE